LSWPPPERGLAVMRAPGRIAILGATSHLARDLVAALATEPEAEAMLFSRGPADVERWQIEAGFAGRFPALDYGAFGTTRYDAIINFVGVGDPARKAAMGAGIFEVTRRFDELALGYLRSDPDCRYVFLSSGAAYGDSFAAPADESTLARFPINALAPSDWYGAAKLHAECLHRSLTDLPIIDLRVFSYFSRTQDIAGAFFVSEILRAIRTRATLRATDQPIARDFLHPNDFRGLIGCLLAAAPANGAVDAYSRAPVDKATLLGAMRDRFGLDYVVEPSVGGGIRQHYYSLNRKAAWFGYRPRYASLECVLGEAAALLGE